MRKLPREPNGIKLLLPEKREQQSEQQKLCEVEPK